MECVYFVVVFAIHFLFFYSFSFVLRCMYCATLDILSILLQVQVRIWPAAAAVFTYYSVIMYCQRSLVVAVWLDVLLPFEAASSPPARGSLPQPQFCPRTVPHSTLVLISFFGVRVG